MVSNRRWNIHCMSFLSFISESLGRLISQMVLLILYGASLVVGSFNRDSSVAGSRLLRCGSLFSWSTEAGNLDWQIWQIWQIWKQFGYFGFGTHFLSLLMLLLSASAFEIGLECPSKLSGIIFNASLKLSPCAAAISTNKHRTTFILSFRILSILYFQDKFWSFGDSRNYKMYTMAVIFIVA